MDEFSDAELDAFNAQMAEIERFCGDAEVRRRAMTPPSNSYEAELDDFNAMCDHYYRFGAAANERRLRKGGC